MEVKEIEQTKTKEKIIEVLDTNGIDYNTTKCNGCERICISVGDMPNYCNSAITVQTCNKDVLCRVYLNEIMFIAIENRKSVLYLTDRKIETHYPIDYWKEILDNVIFAQPHYSYIVNLNYVDEVTKDFVKIKFGNKEYSVYTSSRKIGTFKKAFLNLKR
ncbi:MAG: LytTR family transcriptional regulator DNA-binding domain-containing protein [Clostridia bacterium]|nr:LytTR family transcriptional regulator DNA-binding domain-containing protein [Clostridia bacterium]